MLDRSRREAVDTGAYGGEQPHMSQGRGHMVLSLLLWMAPDAEGVLVSGAGIYPSEAHFAFLVGWQIWLGLPTLGKLQVSLKVLLPGPQPLRGMQGPCLTSHTLFFTSGME